MRNAAAVLIALLTAASGPARIITVDDDNPAAFKTIQAAIGVAVNGDAIIVAPGTYCERINFSGKEIVVRSSDGPSVTVIDGQASGSVVTFNHSESRNACVSGFTIRNGTGSTIVCPGAYGGGIVCLSASPTIENNIVEDNHLDTSMPGYTGGGIAVAFVHDGGPLIRGNIIRGNTGGHGGGIGLCDADAVIRNNLIISNVALTNGGGILSQNGGSWLGENNTIVNNLACRGGGVNVYNSSATLNNNIIANNEATVGGFPGGVWASMAWASVSMSYNNLWNNIGGNSDIGLGVQGISTDPLFINPNNPEPNVRDYRLLPNSPCINTGDPNYVAGPNETDLDGKPRVIGGRIDMGAYEYARQPPGIIYVDTRATGANNGFSWKDAFNHLQDGLAAASAGGEIRVAQGTYKPDKGGGITPGDRATSFHLTNGTIVKGGYAGFGEPDPNARDFVAYETILSGDIGTVADFSDNSYHIVQGGDNAILEGFTLVGGNANGLFQGGYGVGGGLYNDNCRLAVANCTFEENAARNGGAIFNRGGTLAVSESKFVANLATQGGALVNLNGQMTLAKCVLTNNADGTIFCFGNGELQVESCVFDNNYGGWHTIDCSNTGNVIEVINSLFTHNAGGAINSGYNSLLIVNSTLVDNHTTTFGGGVCCSYGSLTAVNCIMWGNTAEWGGDEIFGADAAITVSYSCIAGGYPGTGNINMNPLFCAPASEDYHLLPGSPCINAGDDSAVPPVIETDLDGGPRVIGGRIDMGAYEMPPWVKVPMKFTPQALNCKGEGKWVKARFVLPAEFTVEDVDSNSPAKAQPPGIESEYMNIFINEDGVVEIEAAFDRAAFCDAVKSCGAIEITVTGSLTSGQYFYGEDTIKMVKNSFECLAILSYHWLELNCSKPDCCDGFDADRDTTVNLKDFAIMALRWMESQ